jgi:hypothetical protein
VPVKLRWKFPVVAVEDAETMQEVELVLPTTLRLAGVQVTVTDPAGANAVAFVLIVTGPTK